MPSNNIVALKNYFNRQEYVARSTAASEMLAGAIEVALEGDGQVSAAESMYIHVRATGKFSMPVDRKSQLLAPFANGSIGVQLQR